MGCPIIDITVKHTCIHMQKTHNFESRRALGKFESPRTPHSQEVVGHTRPVFLLLILVNHLDASNQLNLENASSKLWTHGLSQQGVWAPFGHPNPQKSPLLRTPKLFVRNFFKCQFSSI